MKFRVNDNVTIMVGKDKGKTGKITKIFTKQDKAIVEGANKYRRHMKKQSDKNPGGIVEIERPTTASNLQLVCKSCNKITRIGFQVLPSGEKIRICKKCQTGIDTKTTK